MNVLYVDVMLYTILVQMESIGCGFCQYLQICGFGQYRGGAIEFFLTFEFNYIIIRIQLCRCVEQKPELVAHVWLQLVLLTARMTYPFNVSLLRLQFFLSIHPQARGTMEGRPFNVSLLRLQFFLLNYNIIYEQLINIS